MADSYNNWIAKLLGRFYGKAMWAVTISKKTTLYSCSPELVGRYWRAHEEHHKLQLLREGWWYFMTHYFYYNITKGYQDNPYEIQAREAEGRYNV